MQISEEMSNELCCSIFVSGEKFKPSIPDIRQKLDLVKIRCKASSWVNFWPGLGVTWGGKNNLETFCCHFIAALSWLRLQNNLIYLSSVLIYVNCPGICARSATVPRLKVELEKCYSCQRQKQQRRNQRETNCAESLMEVSYRALSHSQRTSNPLLMEYISR